MDEDGGRLYYSLSDDDIGKPFRVITGGSNVGVLRTTLPLDFEATESYTLTIIVEDSPAPSNRNETTINVTVLNVNDHSPMFVMDGGIPVDVISLRVLEETPFPFSLLQLQVCIFILLRLHLYSVPVP